MPHSQNQKNGYKRLGDYIEPVNERNTNGEIKLSQGISNNKYFQTPKQVATDSTKDNIVRKGYFAYNRATTRNGEKISIAYREGEDCTVSGAYQVFRIKDESLLHPVYLWMWFCRPEFDRYARFKSHGSAHEFFEFDEMCEVMLPVPPIEQQQKIVSEYETVTRRIRLNEQIIAKLEETAQALYRKMFVDGIDKENLPEGWRIGTLGEIAEINPRLSLRKDEMCSFVEMDVLPTEGFGIKKVEQKLYSGGTKFQNGDILFARITPCMENGKAAVVMSLLPNEIGAGSTEFIVLRGKEFQLTGLLSAIVREKGFKIFAKKSQTGSDGRQRVEADSLRSFPMLIPPTQKLKEIETVFYCILSHSLEHDQENKLLIKLQSLLLAKMGQHSL